MIDWLTYRVQVVSHTPFMTGCVMSLDADGVVEWSTPKRMEAAGSHESAVFVRALTPNLIEISGNPAKYFQGHNLWGESDPVAIAWCLAFDLGKHFEFDVEDIVGVSRVDIAALIDMGTAAAVQDVIRALGQAGTMRNRGRGNNVDEGTVYFGKRSRRWALKIYDKGKEVVSTKAARKLRNVDIVAPLAVGKMRVELVLRQKELKKLGLQNLDNWFKVDAMIMLRDFLARLELPNQDKRLNISSLPRHLQLPFMQWAQGDDLRTLYPRPTFYRHRRALLDLCGVDVAVPPAQPMTHIDELSAGFATYTHIPKPKDWKFWEPTDQERAQLPTFDWNDFVDGQVRS